MKIKIKITSSSEKSQWLSIRLLSQWLINQGINENAIVTPLVLYLTRNAYHWISTRLHQYSRLPAYAQYYYWLEFLSRYSAFIQLRHRYSIAWMDVHASLEINDVIKYEKLNVDNNDNVKYAWCLAWAITVTHRVVLQTVANCTQCSYTIEVNE